MRQIGFELTRGFARQQYAQWLEKMVTPKDGQAQPTLDQISGEGAMRKARIFTAFGDTPVGKYMEQFADVQPEAAQKLLQKLPRPDAEAEANPRGGPPRPPRGADLQVLIQQVVERRIAAGVAPDVIPEQLSPDLLMMEIRLNNAFRKNPQALDSLLTFARSHLTEVNDLLQMPMTPEGQRVAAVRAPKGRPDRNDPQVQAQMGLKKLGMAYTDLMGMVAPKAAELGGQEGLQQLQAIQAAFSDVIIKNYAAAMHPDQPQMRTNAELAERDLNRLTDPFLPDHEVLRRDAQLRREAIAKQDANLLPNGPPPELSVLEARAAKTAPTPTPPKVDTAPPVVVAEETKVTDPPPVVIDTTTKVTPPADLGVDLKIGPESTISRLRTKAVTPPVIDDTVAQNLAAIEAEKQQQYQKRKGKNSYGEEDDDGGGRGNGRKGAKGYRSAREWREANKDDWEE
jgi:hypothetical protein